MEPDLAALAMNTPWSTAQWSDAWTLTATEFAPGLRKDAWDAVRGIAGAMVVPPDDAARALIRLRIDFAF